MESRYLYHAQPAVIDRMMPAAEALIGQMAHAARAADAVYVLVLHPAHWQTDDALAGEIARAGGLDGQTFERDYPQRRLLAFCRTSGIRCLDLLPVFRRAAGRGRLYRENDTHYSPEGERLAADAIRDYLAAEGLIGAGSAAADGSENKAAGTLPLQAAKSRP
jgi:hypothetical protein